MVAQLFQSLLQCNMNKVFYNPKTLEIKGVSDGEITMDFPFIETEQEIYFFSNFLIEIIDEKPTLVVRKAEYTDEEWSKVVNK